MEGFQEINRGPRRARRRELMQRVAHTHEDEGSMSEMRSSLDAARHAVLTSFSAAATGSLRQIATPNPQLDSDDEEIGNTMSRPGGGPHEPLNERPIDYQGDGDGDEDDEMLMEDMDEGLGENAEDGDVEGDEESDDADDEGGDEWFDPSSMGLKEINNLAHFGVSSHKPGNGVEELLSEDLNQYWQSDGQQPHLLTIHFLRRVEIRAIRFYVDHKQDESYTPTHITFYAGTGHHDLIQFADVPLVRPVGWQDVPLADCGGGPDGHSLCCWVVQMHVKENHQNGKDTHIRGIKIFALDDNAAAGAAGTALHEIANNIDEAADRLVEQHLGEDEDDFHDLLKAMDRGDGAAKRFKPGEGGFSGIPDYMREPELR
ncbi:galactose-binding domain-like protein [Coniochaeta sp. 2T2.1]|nr:galactose-binding domain-like protein [Coniochaeta sp. 2T2.1]